MFTRVVLFVPLLLCLFAVSCAAASSLGDGDRVVFLGDSITGELLYGRMVEDFVTLRSPRARVLFYNVGYGGDTAARRLPRLAREVLSLKPTLVTICYGMNDGWYAPLTPERLEAYRTAMAGLVAGVKAAGARVVLLTPGCVDPEADKYRMLKKDAWTYNETLELLAREVRALAAKEAVPLVDLFPLMLDVQARAKADAPGFTMIPDGIHPDAAGHAVMAYALLKALGCAGPAAGLAIDAAAGKFNADRCTVRDLRVGPARIAFTRADEALPVDFYPAIAPMPRYLPLQDAFNRYPFRVTGLANGRWRLAVDGTVAGTFTAAELAAGVDLAGRPGPWHALAKQVDERTVAAEAEFFQRWIYLTAYPAPEALRADVEAFSAKADARVDRLQALRRQAAAPRPWRWELRKEAK